MSDSDDIFGDLEGDNIDFDVDGIEFDVDGIEFDPNQEIGFDDIVGDSESDDEFNKAVRKKVITNTMDKEEASEKEALAKQARKKRREIMKERRQNKNMIKLYKFFYYFQRLRLHFDDKVFVRENRRNGYPLQIAVTDLDAEVYNQTDKDTYARDFAYSTSGSNFNPDQQLQRHIQKYRKKILADVGKFKAYNLKDSFDDALTSEKDKEQYRKIFKTLKLTNPVYNGTELKYVPVSSMKKRKGYTVRNNGEDSEGNKRRKNGKFKLIEQFNLSLKF